MWGVVKGASVRYRHNILTPEAIDKVGEKKAGPPQKSRAMIKSHCFSGGDFGRIDLYPSTRILNKDRGYLGGFNGI